MDNIIKSSLLNVDNIKNILDDEQINSININNLENISVNSENQMANRNKEKAKELIQRLLKESLDQRILNSERIARNQLISIKNTKDLTLSITNVTLRLSKQIQEKIKRDKEKQTKVKNQKGTSIKNKKGYSPHKSTTNKTSTNFYRSKTPSHYGKNGNNTIHSKTPLAKLKKDLSKSKSNTSLIKNKTSLKNNGTNNKNNIRRKSLGQKTKSSLNFKNFNNMNDYSIDDLHTVSVTSIKTNKTNNININTVANSKLNQYKNLNKASKKKGGLRQNLDISKDSKMSSNTKNLNVTNNNININIKTSSERNIIINLGKKKNGTGKQPILDNSAEKNIKRKKTPFNKKAITETNLNIKKGEKTVEDEIDDILTMECKLQKENICYNDI